MIKTKKTRLGFEYDIKYWKAHLIGKLKPEIWSIRKDRYFLSSDKFEDPIFPDARISGMGCYGITAERLANEVRAWYGDYDSDDKIGNFRIDSGLSLDIDMFDPVSNEEFEIFRSIIMGNSLGGN